MTSAWRAPPWAAPAHTMASHSAVHMQSQRVNRIGAKPGCRIDPCLFGSNASIDGHEGGPGRVNWARALQLRILQLGTGVTDTFAAPRMRMAAATVTHWIMAVPPTLVTQVRLRLALEGQHSTFSRTLADNMDHGRIRRRTCRSGHRQCGVPRPTAHQSGQ